MVRHKLFWSTIRCVICPLTLEHGLNLKKESYCYVICLLFLLLPGAVFLKALELQDHLSLFPGIQRGQQVFDLFAFYKGQLLTWLPPLALLLYFWGYGFPRWEKRFIGPLLLFGGIVLSSLASPWKPLPFIGSPELFETAFVWTSYLILLFLAAEIAKDRTALRRLFWAGALGLVPLLVVGVLQLWGRDPYHLLWVKKLVLPQEFHRLANNFTFSKASHEVYTTIGNPNYVGSLVPLLLPLSILFLFGKRALWQKILAGSVSLVFVAILWGSVSKAGIVGVGGLCISLWVVSARRLPKIMNIVIPLVILCLSIGVTYKVYKMEEFMAFSDLSQLTVTDSSLNMHTPELGLSIRVTDGQLQFYDHDNSLLTLYADQDDRERYLIEQPGYEAFSFRFKTKPADHITMAYWDFHYIFYIVNGEFKIRYYDGRYLPVKLPPRLAFLDDYEHLASDRFYIWSRSVPMLFSDGILGCGADAFTRAYPQEDFYGKFRAYDSSDVIVTKPHNLYLQIGISLGILALIGFGIVIFAFYKESLSVLYTKEKGTVHRPYLIAIVLGVSGYLCAGLFNDSSVAVTPFFWVLLGVGTTFAQAERKGVKP